MKMKADITHLLYAISKCAKSRKKLLNANTLKVQETKPRGSQWNSEAILVTVTRVPLVLLISRSMRIATTKGAVCERGNTYIHHRL